MALFVENPPNDTQLWDGLTTLDGYEVLATKNTATIYIEREVDDTDTVNYSLADFIQSAKVAGVNACYSVSMNLTNCTHYIAPAPVTIFNCERWDGQTILDGTKKFEQYEAYYTVTSYRILDVNDVV